MKGEQNNCVIIHIWASTAPNRIPQDQEVRRVSIEIPQFQNPAEPGSGYYSLWSNLYQSERRSIIEPAPSHYMAGYRRPAHISRMPEGQMPIYDCDAEGRDAEITICLYYLDIYKIREKFETMLKQIGQRARIGKNILRSLQPNDVCSCASLALDLLSAGNLAYLMPERLSLPSTFVPLLIESKKSEQSQQRLSYYTIPPHPGETDISIFQSAWFAGLRHLCTIQ